MTTTTFRKLRTQILSLAVVATAACATGGPSTLELTTDNVRRLQVGVTSGPEVIAMFGKPDQKGLQSDGCEVWTYKPHLQERAIKRQVFSSLSSLNSQMGAFGGISAFSGPAGNILMDEATKVRERELRVKLKDGLVANFEFVESTGAM